MRPHGTSLGAAWGQVGERNRPILLAILNAVLRPASPVESVEVLSSDLDEAAVSDKDIVLDLRVRLQSGEQVDVEMQCRWHRALRERLLFYWARMHSGQLERGVDYTALRRNVVIVFTDFSMLEGQRFHSVFQVRERQSQELFTDQLELHVLELPKLGAASDRNDEPDLARWCKFLSATSDQELDELAMESPTLKQAKEALEELSLDPLARLRAEQRELSRITYELILNDARLEGKDEGFADGEAKGKAEGLLAVFAARGLAVTDEQAAVIRACRNLSQLDAWLRCAISASSCEEVLLVSTS